MRRLKMLLALLLALSVFAAACGDDDDGSADAGASSTDEAGSDSGEIASDFGVDVENKVIRVGINGDLSGPFASLVAEIVESQEVYWEVFNEQGGYQGWTVETVVLRAPIPSPQGAFSALIALITFL